MSREKLSSYVLINELVICVLFIFNVAILNFFIKREDNIVDGDFVQMTDFTVSIENLPEVSEYHNLKQLTAALSEHIREIVGQTEHCLKGLDPNEPHHEIVNMHYAQIKFENYKTLQ